MGDKNTKKIYNTHYNLRPVRPDEDDRGRGVRGSGQGSVGDSYSGSTMNGSRTGGTLYRDYSVGGNSGLVSNSFATFRGPRVLSETRVQISRRTGGRGLSTQNPSNSQESSFISNGNRSRGGGNSSSANWRNSSATRLVSSNSRDSLNITRAGNEVGLCGYSDRIDHGTGNNGGRGDPIPNWRNPIQRIPETIPKPKPKTSFLQTDENKNKGNNNLNLIGNYFTLRTMVHCPSFPMYRYSVKVQFLNTKRIKVFDTKDYRDIVQITMRREYPNLPYLYDDLSNLYVASRLRSENETIELSWQWIMPIMVKLSSMDDNPIDLADVNRYYAAKKFGPPEMRISEHVLTLYDMIFRNLFAQKYKEFDGNYFDFTKRIGQEEADEGNGRLFELVPGFTASVVMTEQSGLALNLALKSAVVFSRAFTCRCTEKFWRLRVCKLTLDKFVLKLISTAAGDPKVCAKNVRMLMNLTQTLAEHISELVNGLQIKTRHDAQQQYTVKRIMSKEEEKRYAARSGLEEMTVRKHYVKFRKNRLFKSYPLVVAVKRWHTKESLIPIELCHLLPDQFVPHSKVYASLFPKDDSSSQLATDEYLNQVISRIKEINPFIVPTLPDSRGSSTIHSDNFKIGLLSKPLEFAGRVLSLPRGIRSSEETVKFDGKWCVLNFDGNCTVERLNDFVWNCFLEKANKFGIDLGVPESYISGYVPKYCGIVKDILQKFKQEVDIKLVLVVLPEGQQTNLTNVIKYYAEHVHDYMIHTIKGDVVKNMGRSDETGYFEDFLATLKTKLGGKSSTVQYFPNDLPIKMNETMVVGLTVNYSDDFGSIVAAVGSTDRDMTNFTSTVQVQQPREDIVVKDLEKMILDLLEQYLIANQIFPKSVIVFRDGVPDGMFGMLLKEEYPKIRKAIGKKIKLTVIGVVEEVKHNSRFGLSDEDGFGSEGSVPIGTVVDSTDVDRSGGVIHVFKNHFNYLLDSLHPNKYVVLCDDHNLSTEHVQLFCNFTCFNTVGTQKILSIPAPVMCARKCAQRAKSHLDGARLVHAENGDSIPPVDLLDHLNQEVRVGEYNKNRFYYL